MDDPTDDTNSFVKLTSFVVLGVGLAALFLGFEWFWVVFAVGFAVGVPLVKVLTEMFGVGTTGERDQRPHRSPSDHTADTESKQDALDELRSRYARGDLSDEEFDRKVETLLETDTPESARTHVERETETATDR